MIEHRPAIIARCAEAADVISAVNFARNNGPSVSVRAGGQNVSGNAVCDRGPMIDRSPMKSVRHPLGLPRNDRGGRGLTGAMELKLRADVGLRSYQQEEIMGRGLLLWLIGIPIPIILLIWLFGGLH
jgi:hypothetical protein